MLSWNENDELGAIGVYVFFAFYSKSWKQTASVRRKAYSRIDFFTFNIQRLNNA